MGLFSPGVCGLGGADTLNIGCSLWQDCPCIVLPSSAPHRRTDLLRRSRRPYLATFRLAGPDVPGPASDIIKVAFLDQFSQNFEDSVLIRAELTQRDIGIVAVREQIDTREGRVAGEVLPAFDVDPGHLLPTGSIMMLR